MYGYWKISIGNIERGATTFATAALLTPLEEHIVSVDSGAAGTTYRALISIWVRSLWEGSGREQRETGESTLEDSKA